MIQIVFEFTTKYGVYRDALYLPDDHGLTEAEIDAMKQARVGNWLAIVEAPPPPVEEVPAEEPASDA
jgi:hypothetical protein